MSIIVDLYNRRVGSQESPHGANSHFNTNKNHPKPMALSKRRRTRANRTEQIGYLPFGHSMSVRLPYAFNVPLATTVADVATSHIFQINSMYDPDLSGVGHQPYQWDQIAPMYSNYRVTAVEYDITFTDPNYDGSWVGIQLRTGLNAGDAIAGKNLQNLRERAYGQWKTISDSGSQEKSFKGTVPIGDLFGVDPETLFVRQSNISATNTSPIDVAVLEVGFVEPIGGKYVYVAGKFVLHCTLTGYKGPGQS